MPWKKSENNIYERQTVECSDCSEWFHKMRERIPDAVIRKSQIRKKKKLKMRLVVLSVLIKKS